MDYEKPNYSPWGEVQTCLELCPGVFQVSTAGHGGVMAREELVQSLFSPAALKHSFQSHGCHCFEEDCDAAVALWELLQKRRCKAPDYWKPSEYADCLASSIQHHFPEYWDAQKKAKATPDRKRDGMVR